MQKLQIVAIVVAVVAVVAIYNLPKAIINKSDKQKLGSKEAQMPKEQLLSSKTITDKDSKIISSLINLYNNAVNVKNSINFANSLAKKYVSLSYYDSAAVYADRLVLSHRGNFMCLKAAGDIYYTIYMSIANPSSSGFYAEKAREYYSAYLKNDSTNLPVRNNMAMTYVVSNTPMQAIMELRKILVIAPSNVQAQFNLGLLAMQSGQYDKAVNRFKTLAEADAKNWNAKYYLALSLIETKKKQDARNVLLDIIKNGSDLILIADCKNTLATID